MGMGDFAKDYAYGVDAKPTDYVPEPATFEGIVRPDGRVATRNYIGILTSVNCSAHTASLIADAFKRNPFTGYEPLGGVDGFDEDEAESECDEGAEVLVRFLAAERNALEALELADEVFDAGAGAIERLREERWSVPGR